MDFIVLVLLVVDRRQTDSKTLIGIGLPGHKYV